jgi:uncharacterized protein YndB with AHSA1/START domain
MTSKSQSINLIMTRTFDAPVEQVWNAWTEPELVMQWWGPDGFIAPLVEMDLREGSTAFLCMSSPDFGNHYSIWHYHKIVPMQRIEYVHKLADECGNKIDPVAMGMPADFPQDQKQVVLFKRLAASKTELTVIEYGWTAGQMMEMSRMGLTQCLNKMETLFTKRAA